MSDRLDKAIKASSEDEPPFSRPPSPPRLEGEKKQEFLAIIDNSPLCVPPGYDHVNVVDFLGFNPKTFDYLLVNYYYEHEEDPRTRIISRRIFADNRVTTA